MGTIIKNKINYSGSIQLPNGLSGAGYIGKDLILRDANGNIDSVWYLDELGNWVEYKKGESGSPGGHTFGILKPNVTTTITNSFSISVE